MDVYLVASETAFRCALDDSNNSYSLRNKQVVETVELKMISQDISNWSWFALPTGNACSILHIDT